MIIQIPPFISHAIYEVDERHLEFVLKKTRITEDSTFKKFAINKQCSNTLYRDFTLSLFDCNKATIETLYRKLEGILFLGGCAPGVGIAFNLIDAVFCCILNNWLGCFVAIISCFPIPGFKVAGKGLEKFIVSLVKRIPVDKLFSFVKLLGKRLSSIGFHSAKSYIIIRQQLEDLIKGLHNPFCNGVIHQLSKIISCFPVSSKKVSSSISNVSKELTQNKLVNVKLLNMTIQSRREIINKYDIKPHNITKGNSFGMITQSWR